MSIIIEITTLLNRIFLRELNYFLDYLDRKRKLGTIFTQLTSLSTQRRRKIEIPKQYPQSDTQGAQVQMKGAGYVKMYIFRCPDRKSEVY